MSDGGDDSVRVRLTLKTDPDFYVEWELCEDPLEDSMFVPLHVDRAMCGTCFDRLEAWGQALNRSTVRALPEPPPGWFAGVVQ